LESSSPLFGAISGAGTLLLASGNYTYENKGVFNIANVVVDHGAGLVGTGTISSAIADAGSVRAEGGKLTLTGSLSGSGALVAEAGATLDLTAGGTLSEAASGAGTLELAAVYTLAGATLTTGTVQIDSAGALFGNGSVAGAVTIDGAVTGKGGTLSFGGAVSNFGTLEASLGLVTLNQSVSGTGLLTIGDTGTLSLLDGAAAGQTVSFLSPDGLLDIAHPLNFLGTIAGFAAGDTIDVLRTPHGTFTYTDNALSLISNGATVAVLNFNGSYSMSDFALTSDGHGGTDITLT
jgi:hypothetical protein